MVKEEVILGFFFHLHQHKYPHASSSVMIIHVWEVLSDSDSDLMAQLIVQLAVCSGRVLAGRGEGRKAAYLSHPGFCWPARDGLFLKNWLHSEEEETRDLRRDPIYHELYLSFCSLFRLGFFERAFWSRKFLFKSLRPGLWNSIFVLLLS